MSALEAMLKAFELCPKCAGEPVKGVKEGRDLCIAKSIIWLQLENWLREGKNSSETSEVVQLCGDGVGAGWWRVTGSEVGLFEVCCIGKRRGHSGVLNTGHREGEAWIVR